MSIYPSPGLPLRRQPYRPQCTHLTMTRIYGPDMLCDVCRRKGPFGWVYRCTQDREDFIESVVAHGYVAHFDELGHYMSSRMTLRPRSAAARADRFSFFGEVTQEQMSEYRPDQVQTILRQREGVQLAISRETAREALNAQNTMGQAGGQIPPRPIFETATPWVAPMGTECRYTICSLCRPSAADRSFLSLSGIADGDIQPTSAVGYGFHVLGRRPVVDVEILRSISCRPVPLPRRIPEDENSPAGFNRSMLAMLESQLAKGHSLLAIERATASAGPGRPRAVTNDSTAPPETDAGRLKHSPRCENLAVYAQPPPGPDHGSSIRPPWTPPPSPGPGEYKNLSTDELRAEGGILSGRSSNSLKTNVGVRHQVLRSVPSASALDRINQTGHASPSQAEIPYMPEAAYDVGLTLPFNREVYELARMTPLEPRGESRNEEVDNAADQGVIEEDALPVHVDNGVAMMEESLELGVPDVVTQV